jgi:hypothetical protein
VKFTLHPPATRNTGNYQKAFASSVYNISGEVR